MLDPKKLFALVLCDLSKWRDTLRARRTLMCQGQQELIVWPTWLASESRGRVAQSRNWFVQMLNIGTPIA